MCNIYSGKAQVTVGEPRFCIPEVVSENVVFLDTRVWKRLNSLQGYDQSEYLVLDWMDQWFHSVGGHKYICMQYFRGWKTAVSNARWKNLGNDQRVTEQYNFGVQGKVHWWKAASSNKTDPFIQSTTMSRRTTQTYGPPTCNLNSPRFTTSSKVFEK